MQSDGAATSAGAKRLRGHVVPGFESVREALEGPAAALPGDVQLCVLRHDEVVVDLWTASDDDATGFGPDSLVQLASTSKGVTALVAARLIDRGLLDIDRPAAEYWPEFTHAGKAAITVEQILTHTAGIPGFPRAAGLRAQDLGDWVQCASALADARPIYPPGEHVVYHGMTYGYLVGELVRRITGRTVGALLRDEIATPLGLDLWIGLPDERHDRVVPRFFWRSGDGPDGRTPTVVSDPAVFDPEVPVLDDVLIPAGARQFMQSPAGLTAEIPSSNGVATARAIARMYAATIGSLPGPPLLSAPVLDVVCTPRTAHLVPHQGIPGPPPRFGLGFLLDESAAAGGFLTGTFGHPGTGGTQGFAHVGTGIAAGYTCTGMAFGAEPDGRLAWVNALALAVGEAGRTRPQVR